MVCIVCGVAKSRTCLNDFHIVFPTGRIRDPLILGLGKEMYKMSLGHLVQPDNRKPTRTTRIHPHWPRRGQACIQAGPRISLPGSNVRLQFSSVQSLSHVRLFATPWTVTHQASLSITNSGSLPKLMSTESVIPSNHSSCCPLVLPLSTFPSIRVFSNESVLPIRWRKYWSFRFSISPSNEYSGLISFRMDWLDLLAVQAWTEAKYCIMDGWRISENSSLCSF